ncbi:Uncharacterized protein TCM_015846 [Theobroma cacao]|uniref:Uncharacterized protein n=1 Tax=Theobroma cacao TaxID=3641 RepID=A0A061G473_THECC|nr:Uncharacterized protein TCM_015846 [Theobroma cacao]
MEGFDLESTLHRMNMFRQEQRKSMANTLAAQQFHGEYRRSGSRTSTWLLTDNHGSESIVAPHIKSTITSTTSTTGPFPSPLLSPISRNSLVGCFKSGFTK